MSTQAPPAPETTESQRHREGIGILILEPALEEEIRDLGGPGGPPREPAARGRGRGGDRPDRINRYLLIFAGICLLAAYFAIIAVLNDPRRGDR